jgi:hypothetical protein
MTSFPRTFAKTGRYCRSWLLDRCGVAHQSILAKGMQADDIRLEAVNSKQAAVLCSMTVAAKGLIETVTYVIRAEVIPSIVY